MSKKPCSISFKPTGKNKPCTTVINGGLKVKKNIVAECDLTVNKCLNVKNIVYSNTETITESGQTVSGVKSLSWINTNGTGVLSDNTKDGFYKKVVKISEGNAEGQTSVGNTGDINNIVYTIAFDQNNEGPYVGGTISNVANLGIFNLAKWTGSSWTSVGNGNDITDLVATIAFDQNNEGPYVGGSFTNVAGITELDRLAKWTGSSWTSVGNTGDLSSSVFVNTIAFDQNGDGPYIGGQFTDVAGITGLDYLAKWTGSSWTSVGNTGDFSSPVQTIVFDKNGDGPYVGGIFTNLTSPGINNLAKWTGNSWTSVGNTGDINNFVLTIAFDQNNEGPYVGGLFTDVAGIIGINRLAKWTGSSWTSVGNTGDFSGLVETIAFDKNGDGPYVGGEFNNVANLGINKLAKWTGSSWTSVGNTGYISDRVRSVEFDQNGDGPYVGGSFTSVAGITGLDRLAKWTGTSWTSVGNTGDINNPVFTMAFDQINEGPYIGGQFTDVAGITGLDRLAKFEQAQNYTLTYNTTETLTLTNVGENACFIYSETLGEWVKI